MEKETKEIYKVYCKESGRSDSWQLISGGFFTAIEEAKKAAKEVTNFHERRQKYLEEQAIKENSWLSFQASPIQTMIISETVNICV